MAFAPDYDAAGIKYYNIPTFQFLSGETLTNIRIAYKSLNASSPKKALVPTCYGGTINSTQTFNKPSEALASHNVIVVAMLGNGESASPSNTPGFPKTLDYQDQINAQHDLLTTHLGITVLDVVLGFSMGGQQAYYWASMHSSVTPSSSFIVHNAVVICGSARTSGHNYAFLEGPTTALQNSADYADGAYQARAGVRPARGLRAFGRAYGAWLTSGAWYRERLWEKALGFASVEEYLRGGPDKAFQGWDPEDLLILARQWQAGDISKVKGKMGYEDALGSIEARVLVMPSRTDQYFAWEDGEEECRHLNRGRLEVIPTVWGHIAGGGANEADNEWMNGKIGEFLGQR